MKKYIFILIYLISAMNIMAADLRYVSEAENDEDSVEFIFDPEGTEKIYCMSLYSYNSNTGNFGTGWSLKSQVRFAEDGETVYFKDLTKSLGAITWVKGTIDGDTIRIPFGQPLVYYKGYLVFFCPVVYDDNLEDDNVIAQDELKLVIKGDSLVSPYLGEGRFQGASGYVVISEQKQGMLSLDLDQNLRLMDKPFALAPDDVEPALYVYTMENSHGSTYKTKVNVKKAGNNLYMQLSTSAPDAYVLGTIGADDSITVESGQAITDGKFIYYYSLADPVYDEEKTDSIVDFLPAVQGARLLWHEDTKEITSSPMVFSVDYMDGMEYCMEYVTNPRLSVYGGNKPAIPMTPELQSLNLDGYQPYISFNVFALDREGNYINRDSMTYRLFFDGEPYIFYPETYMNLQEETEEIAYDFEDNYDFFVYDQLHYVYLYEDLYTTIGVQSVYTVDGAKFYSDIIQYDVETGEESVVSGMDEVIANTHHPGAPTTQVYNLAGQRIGTAQQKGIFILGGKKVIR